MRFRQILINLIANAIKFTTAGNSARSDDIFPAMGSRYAVKWRIPESGWKKRSRERIFEAFFQADGTLRRRFGGTGLGLTISKQLVEIMGGRIGTNNNDPEPGATFWFQSRCACPK